MIFNKLIYRLFDAIALKKSALFIAFSLALFATSHLAIYTVLFWVGYFNIENKYILWGSTILLSIMTLISMVVVGYLTYRFEINQKILGLSFSVLPKDAHKIYLYRALVKNRLQVSRIRDVRSLPLYLKNAVTVVAKELSLADKNSLMYLSGINHIDILSRFSASKDRVVLIASDNDHHPDDQKNHENIVITKLNE